MSDCRAAGLGDKSRAQAGPQTSIFIAGRWISYGTKGDVRGIEENYITEETLLMEFPGRI